MKTLIALLIRWTGMVEVKNKDFTVAVRIMTCQNSPCVMGLRIYGEGRTHIPLSSPAAIDPLGQDVG